jgi:hypothetical protein
MIDVAAEDNGLVHGVSVVEKLTDFMGHYFVSLWKNYVSIDIDLVVGSVVNQISIIIDHPRFRTPAL